MSALDSRSMSEDDADEITTLEPEPVRITFQWEQPAFQRAHGDQSLDGEESALSFAPTILGDRRTRRELDGFSWAALLPSRVGAFRGMPPAPFWVLIIGAGLMLLSGLVLLGEEPAASGLAEIRRDEQPVIASTDRAEAEPPLSAVPTSFVRPAEIQEPAATTKRERERPDSARAVATRSESGTARPSTTVKAGEPASGEPAQPKRRVIVVGSELAKNASRKDVPAAAEQRVNKPRSSREPAAGAVRPRVVTVSKN